MTTSTPPDRRSVLSLVLGAAAAASATSALADPARYEDADATAMATRFVARYRRSPTVRREFRRQLSAVRRTALRGGDVGELLERLGRYAISESGGPEAPGFIIIIIIIILVLIPLAAS